MKKNIRNDLYFVKKYTDLCGAKKICLKIAMRRARKTERELKFVIDRKKSGKFYLSLEDSVDDAIFTHDFLYWFDFEKSFLFCQKYFRV